MESSFSFSARIEKTPCKCCAGSDVRNRTRTRLSPRAAEDHGRIASGKGQGQTVAGYRTRYRVGAVRYGVHTVFHGYVQRHGRGVDIGVVAVQNHVDHVVVPFGEGDDGRNRSRVARKNDAAGIFAGDSARIVSGNDSGVDGIVVIAA